MACVGSGHEAKSIVHKHTNLINYNINSYDVTVVV